MQDYIYREGNTACLMDYLEFEICSLETGESLTVGACEKETALTILSGSCSINVNGAIYETGMRKGIFSNISPHVTFMPAGLGFKISAMAPLKFSIAKTITAGNLNEAVHVGVGAVNGFKRGTGQTSREIYELTPKGTPSNLLVYEVFTPGGNWSSFPPHKHDTEAEDERLLQEVYYFSFDPPEGFALIWISDDSGDIDKAYSVKNGDLVAIPHGYHTMCVSPGYTCSTHCVMAGPSNEWKVKIKPAYRHLLDWKR